MGADRLYRAECLMHLYLARPGLAGSVKGKQSSGCSWTFKGNYHGVAVLDLRSSASTRVAALE